MESSFITQFAIAVITLLATAGGIALGTSAGLWVLGKHLGKKERADRARRFDASVDHLRKRLKQIEKTRDTA